MHMQCTSRRGLLISLGKQLNKHRTDRTHERAHWQLYIAYMPTHLLTISVLKITYIQRRRQIDVYLPQCNEEELGLTMAWITWHAFIQSRPIVWLLLSSNSWCAVVLVIIVKRDVQFPRQESSCHRSWTRYESCSVVCMQDSGREWYDIIEYVHCVPRNAIRLLRSVSTTRVHGPSSRAELTARELGCIFWHPSTRLVNSARELG